jgi:hypothetical protein
MRVAAMASNQVLPLLAKCLQRGFAGAVAADVCRSDGVPSLLGSSFLKKRELHLGRDCSNEGIQRPSILVVIDVAVPNWLPHVPHLEPYPHHRSPLDVVGLGEGRPPAAGTDVPDNVLDSMVTMVPVRGGRAVLPIRAAISDNPAAGASAPVWAAAAARAPAWSVVCSRAASLVGTNRATGATGAQSLELCRRRTRCIRRIVFKASLKRRFSVA